MSGGCHPAGHHRASVRMGWPRTRTGTGTRREARIRAASQANTANTVNSATGVAVGLGG